MLRENYPIYGRLRKLVKFSSFLGDDEVILEVIKISWYLCEESFFVWYNVVDKQWSVSSFTVCPSGRLKKRETTQSWLKLAVNNLHYRFVWPSFSPFNFGLFKMWYSYLIIRRKICAFLKLNNEQTTLFFAYFEITTNLIRNL